MDESQKRELHNLFKFIISSQISSEKYGSASSYEELDAILSKNPKDLQQVQETLSSFTDEELLAIAEKSNKEESENIVMAKKGAYLKKLKKGGKKCSCGCSMVLSKGDGGKMISKCGCGCKEVK